MHIRKISEDPQSAAHLAARREWNERYGNISPRRGRRLTAFLSLGIAAVAVVGAVWIGSQTTSFPTWWRPTRSMPWRSSVPTSPRRLILPDPRAACQMDR